MVYCYTLPAYGDWFKAADEQVYKHNYVQEEMDGGEGGRKHECLCVLYLCGRATRPRGEDRSSKDI